MVKTTGDGTLMPSEQEVIGYFKELSNWGRWGQGDELGTLNLVTKDKRRSAISLVREGELVSLSRRLVFNPVPGPPEARITPLHMLSVSGHDAPEVGLGHVSDWIGIPIHGRYITHIDSPAHILWNARVYGDRPANLISASEGASICSVEVAAQGLLSRGLLLDIPSVRGVEFMVGNDGVSRKDLEMAEEQAGARTEPGDFVYVRTGYGMHRANRGGFPGLTASCLPWLRERDAAIIATDVALDASAFGYPTLPMPVHAVGLVAMGLWVIDNCDFESLVASCQRYNRWTFLTAIAPLALVGASGSPVNPIAVF